MPHENKYGLEFYDLVGKRPELAAIPAILITANPARFGLEAERRRIRVLEKPFDLDTSRCLHFTEHRLRLGDQLFARPR